MPITVFDVKGIPSGRRKAIEAAGRTLSAPHEAWITTDPVRGGFKVLVTGPHGFERSVSFAMDENSGAIAAHVRAALED